MNSNASGPAGRGSVDRVPARSALRRRLRETAEQFLADSSAAEAANRAIGPQLQRLIGQLEPTILGLYSARGSEFNAAPWFPADALGPARLALPLARRDPPRLEYRAWDGEPPRAVDEHGIATGDGPPVEPDVVLVPCVGYTRAGHRLGYGGGYFDRWLAAHRGVTAIGVAWSCTEIPAGDFVPEIHDVPLTLIVDERGIVG